MTVTTFADLLPSDAVADPARSHPHRAPTWPTLRLAARRRGSRVWVTTRRTVARATILLVAALAVALRVTGRGTGPAVRAAWDDVRTLAGYWPGVAGLVCLVKAASLVGPGAGWVAAGVALLLVGAVARS